MGAAGAVDWSSSGGVGGGPGCCQGAGLSSELLTMLVLGRPCQAGVWESLPGLQ